MDDHRPHFDPDDPRYFYDVMWRNYAELYDKNAELCDDLKETNKRVDKLTIKQATMWAYILTIASALTIIINVVAKLPSIIKFFQSVPK